MLQTIYPLSLEYMPCVIDHLPIILGVCYVLQTICPLSMEYAMSYRPSAHYLRSMARFTEHLPIISRVCYMLQTIYPLFSECPAPQVPVLISLTRSLHLFNNVCIPLLTYDLNNFNLFPVLHNRQTVQFTMWLNVLLMFT